MRVGVGLLIAVALIALGVALWAWSLCVVAGRADDRIAVLYAEWEREQREQRALARRRPELVYRAGMDVLDRQASARLN